MPGRGAYLEKSHFSNARRSVSAAGINRANLAVVAYLTWLEGMDRDAALSLVQAQRPQANPYMVGHTMSFLRHGLKCQLNGIT